jgi:hypothetical protein
VSLFVALYMWLCIVTHGHLWMHGFSTERLHRAPQDPPPQNEPQQVLP